MLSNYEISNGVYELTSQDIIDEFDSVKENVSGGLPFVKNYLGKAIKQLWGEKVTSVRRGLCDKQKRFYLNLRKKSNLISNPSVTAIPPTCTSFQAIESEYWVKKTLEEKNVVGFMHCENWSFRNQRVVTELKATNLGSGAVSYALSSHGHEITMDNLLESSYLETLPMDEQLRSVLKFVEKSPRCQGIQVTESDTIETLIDYDIGEISRLSSD